MCYFINLEAHFWQLYGIVCSRRFNYCLKYLFFREHETGNLSVTNGRKISLRVITMMSVLKAEEEHFKKVLKQNPGPREKIDLVNKIRIFFQVDGIHDQFALPPPEQVPSNPRSLYQLPIPCKNPSYLKLDYCTTQINLCSSWPRRKEK